MIKEQRARYFFKKVNFTGKNFVSKYFCGNNGVTKKKTRFFRELFTIFCPTVCDAQKRKDLIWYEDYIFTNADRQEYFFFHFHERKANILKPRPYLWAHVYYNLTNKCSFFSNQTYNKKIPENFAPTLSQMFCWLDSK